MSEFSESIKGRGWTPERRARQAERIREWRPWEKSTGPRSEVGKVIVSRNAWRGGARQQARLIAGLLRDNAHQLQQMLRR